MREGIEGNLCRCTGYHNIVKAVLAAANGGGGAMTAVVGTRMVRKEDPELLTGEGRFVDDLVIPGARWLGMVRSPFAHARITGIDVSEALTLPGVTAVLTGADLRDAWAAPMPCAWPVTEDMKNPEHFPVAIDKACYVGDIVAVVVADSRYAAADAVGAVDVSYEPLDAVVDLEDALSRSRRHPRRPRHQQELHVGAHPRPGGRRRRLRRAPPTW